LQIRDLDLRNQEIENANGALEEPVALSAELDTFGMLDVLVMSRQRYREGKTARSIPPHVDTLRHD